MLRVTSKDCLSGAALVTKGEPGAGSDGFELSHGCRTDIVGWYSPSYYPEWIWFNACLVLDRRKVGDVGYISVLYLVFCALNGRLMHLEPFLTALHGCFKADLCPHLTQAACSEKLVSYASHRTNSCPNFLPKFLPHQQDPCVEHTVMFCSRCAPGAVEWNSLWQEKVMAKQLNRGRRPVKEQRLLWQEALLRAEEFPVKTCFY